MGELLGKCPKCKAAYWGWALTNPPRQKCEKCGSMLEILENHVTQSLSETNYMSQEALIITYTKKVKPQIVPKAS